MCVGLASEDTEVLLCHTMEFLQANSHSLNLYGTVVYVVYIVVAAALPDRHTWFVLFRWNIVVFNLFERIFDRVDIYFYDSWLQFQKYLICKPYSCSCCLVVCKTDPEFNLNAFSKYIFALSIRSAMLGLLQLCVTVHLVLELKKSGSLYL